MSDLSIGKISGKDDAFYTKPLTQSEDNRKKASLFTPEGQFTAYMPLGGIGSLLNGKESQSVTTAHNA